MKYMLADGSKAEIGWDINGWDWDEQDFSWLSSQTSLPDGGFFVHGGYIRHQRHVPWGDYTVEAFVGLIAQLADGIQDVKVLVMEDTGGGDPGFWIEGMRPPKIEDVEALAEVRKRRDRDDERNYQNILKRHPEWAGSEEREVQGKTRPGY